MPKGRLEAFSDGIIAFAITLLILDIHLQDLPADVSNVGMFQALVAILPHFAIYVVSFLICTVWWVTHNALIHDLDHVDAKLLWLNSLFLMWIAILPFPTGLLGQHPGQPVAIGLYGIVCTIACVLFSIMRWYASYRGKLMKKDITEAKLRRYLRISLSFPFLYLAATVAGFFIPSIGLLSYAAIPIIVTAYRLFIEKEHGTHRHPGMT